MTEPVWKQIKRLREWDDEPHHVANRVLERCFVENPPVDVDRIAALLDVEVIRTEAPGWSGAVRSTSDSATIWLASEEAFVRQRFTLAHELGHLLLHPDGEEFRDIRFRGNRRESEANRFAASLLIPEWMLEPIVFFESDRTKLARIFRVSERAMQIRVADIVGENVQW